MSLTREQWGKVEDLFTQALECAAEARERWLRHQQEQADPVVYAELISLLAAGDTADDPHIALISGVAPQAPAVPVSHFSPWRLLQLLGRGGMGEAYPADPAEGSSRQR